MIDTKTILKDVKYDQPDAEGWFKVTVQLPQELKTGEYYLLWESKRMFHGNKAQSHKFFISNPNDQQQSAQGQQQQQQQDDDDDEYDE